MRNLHVNMKRRGFTLAELLIVVAIIAVLVAVAIPVFTAQLNKAKYATDEANARSIYAELTADYLANGEQTYTIGDPASVTAGTPCSIVINKGSDGSSTYSFNGMANITFTLGDADTAPYVTIDECQYNDGDVVFGSEP